MLRSEAKIVATIHCATIEKTSKSLCLLLGQFDRAVPAVRVFDRLLDIAVSLVAIFGPAIDHCFELAALFVGQLVLLA